MAPASRPWQGTTLGVLEIIGLIFMAIILAGLTFFLIGGVPTNIQSLINAGQVEGSGDIVSMFKQIIGAATAVIGVMFILLIFVTIGIFKGRKWSVITALVFSILGVLGGLGNLGEDVDSAVVQIAISGFMIYLEIACLQHPFYSKKAVK